MWTNIKSSLRFEGLFQQTQHVMNLYRSKIKICEPIARSSYVYYTPTLTFQFRSNSNYVLIFTP